MANNSKKAAKKATEVAFTKNQLAEGFKIFHTGGNVLGAAKNPLDWEPESIRYYKIGLGAQGGLQFAYLEESGVAVYDNPSDYQTDIDSFVEEVLAGTPNTTPFGRLERAPDLVAGDSCYIVVELDAAVGWRFACEGSPIQTQFDCSYFYFTSVRVDTDGVRYDDTKKMHATAISRVMYFGVNLKAAAPQNPIHVKQDIEKFSLFIESDRGFGKSIPLILDPDIRNDGGTNPPLIGMSRRSKGQRSSLTGAGRRVRR